MRRSPVFQPSVAALAHTIDPPDPLPHRTPEAGMQIGIFSPHEAPRANDRPVPSLAGASATPFVVWTARNDAMDESRESTCQRSSRERACLSRFEPLCRI